MTETPDPFHLLARDNTPSPRKRSIAEALLLIAGFFVFFIVMRVSLDLVAGDYADTIGNWIAFAAFAPALILAVKVGGKRPLRQLFSSSEQPQRNFASTTCLAALPVAALIVILCAVSLPNPASTPNWPEFTFALLVTPVMAFLEEVFFRAWMPQLIGYWTRNAWVAFLLPVPVFALFHGAASAGAFIAFLVSGTCFAFLAKTTQGVAASSVLHAVSNMTIIVLGAVMNFDSVGTNVSHGAKALALALVTAALLAFFRSRQPAKN